MFNFKFDSLESDILLVLDAQELYGLDLLAQINPGRLIPLTYGGLYPALKRLEKKGLIQSHWGEQAINDAKRAKYSLTDEGKLSLRKTAKIRTPGF